MPRWYRNFTARAGTYTIDLVVGLRHATKAPGCRTRLFEIAKGQHGFFTAKQAKAAGFAENTDPCRVQAGNWIREHRGIYRLGLFPSAEHPDLMTWAVATEYVMSS